MWPIQRNDGYISQSFGVPGNYAAGVHTGTDFVASKGTPILAVRSGRVVAADYAGDYGRRVIIDHGSIATLYAHMSKITVRDGEYVSQGERIGRIGSSGNATGPHVHYEERTSAFDYWSFRRPRWLDDGTNVNEDWELGDGFPGTGAFVVGQRHPAVKQVDKWLITLGYTEHNDGNGYQAGTLFTEYTKANIQDFQREIGDNRFDNGILGQEQWSLLRRMAQQGGDDGGNDDAGNSDGSAGGSENGTWEPDDEFPGRDAFQIGQEHPAVVQLDKWLIAAGYADHYAGNSYEPGPTFTKYTRENVQDFQLAQGWTGKRKGGDADGYPGPETWERLQEAPQDGSGPSEPSETGPGWYPEAIHKEIPPGSNDPPIKPWGAVLHVDAGNNADLYDWFNGPSGGIESHFQVPKEGKPYQYRSVLFEADANLKGNSFRANGELVGHISLETQGFASGTWNAHQLTQIKRILTWLHSEHGVPLREPQSWDDRGIHTHCGNWGCPGPFSNHSKNCPGPERIDQYWNIILPWATSGDVDDEHVCDCECCT